MSNSASARWQSITETFALVVVAVAVASIAIVKSTSESISARPAAPARRPEAPLPTQPVSLIGAQTMGSQDAKVALVVYSDFQCPYCGKFARETLPSIEEQYVRTGKVLLASMVRGFARRAT